MRVREEKEDLLKYGPLCITVLSRESWTKTEMVINCQVTSGRVAVGETLIYRPQFGGDTPVNLKRIETMMMDMETAFEGTCVTMTITGDFSMFAPTVNDTITR